MQMIGRADHYQIERAVFQQRRRVGIGRARCDVVLLQDRSPTGDESA